MGSGEMPSNLRQMWRDTHTFLSDVPPSHWAGRNQNGWDKYFNSPLPAGSDCNCESLSRRWWRYTAGRASTTVWWAAIIPLIVGAEGQAIRAVFQPEATPPCTLR
eukprot:TRINITY_DN3909_c0_g1_i1.p1 TRINITY_DN3909_c0_g1~~TRINITY_DN3909_c0_g1_i1.p1  ORF type:complete len:105 (-),score=10.55 TRINITY_DN3909_c0_g1_i1:5-319(-)